MVVRENLINCDLDPFRPWFLWCKHT